MINGNYTITNAQSGRKIYDRADHFWPDEVGAIGGEYFADQIWRIEPTTPDGYTITNVHSGRRLYAHAGRDFCDGFGTTVGIVHEDQKWHIQQASGDSYTIVNAMTSRRLVAEGGDGGVCAVAEAQSLPDEEWYLREEPVAPI